MSTAPEEIEVEPAEPAAPPPHGLTLFDHATISAEIAEARMPLVEILAARSLVEAQWNEATAFWMGRMLEDVRAHRERARVAIVYSGAFGDAQDALAPVPPMSPEAYADLLADAQRDGDPKRALAARNLTQADYQRIGRHFARRLSADAGEAQRFIDRFAARTAPPDPEGP